MHALEELLDACRKRSGYSWKQVADLLDVDKAHLSRIKNGKRRVMTNRDRWHAALAMTPEEIEVFDACMDKPDAEDKIWEWLDAIADAVTADALVVARLETFFLDRSDLFSETDLSLLHEILRGTETTDRAQRTIKLMTFIRR